MIGRSVSHYRITSLLGKGGMGEVYAAHDEQLNREVALKFLSANALNEPELRARFKLEAQAAAALNHKNIATIHGVDEFEGQMFLVLEHAGSMNLEQKLRAGRVDLDEALRLAVEIAEGLAAAHAKGIVHRDIKPANILLGEDGHCKITDFGLARLADSTQITRDGTTLGTPSYMSPEQARGEDTDQRSDVWALGVILYELLGGQRPFRGEKATGIIYSIVHEAPAPLPADIPAELRNVVDRALVKDKNQRYASAGEMLQALRAIAGGSHVATQSFSAVAPKRKRAWIYPAAALLVAVAAYFVWSQRQPEDQQIDSLAVLPLLLDSGNSDNEYLADGISESLIGALSQDSELRVISWFATLRMKGKELDPQEVGRRLGVDAVVAGMLSQRDDELRISLELISVEDGRQIWSHRFVDSADRIVLMQDDITQQVAATLNAGDSSGAGEPALALHQTEDPQAYRLYLKGRFLWNRFEEDDTELAIESYKQALEIDPGFALAYAGLADAYLLLASFQPWDKVVPIAKAYAQKSIELDPDLADGHYILADILYSFDWDWETAQAELDRALELNPNNAMALKVAGDWACDRGDIPAMMANYERAIDLDPLSHMINCSYNGRLARLGQYERAIEHATYTLELEETCSSEYRVRGVSYLALKEREKGMKDISVVAEESRNPEAAYLAADLFAEVADGDIEAARARLTEMREKGLLGEDRDPYGMAADYASVGEKEEALDWLEKALEVRDPALPALVGDSRLDSIRDEPRFKAVLQKMGLSS